MDTIEVNALNDLCPKVPTPPGVDQITMPQKICLNEKHVLSEATPLQKRPCKSHSQSKLKNRENFTSANSYSKSKTQNRKIDTLNFYWSQNQSRFVI